MSRKPAPRIMFDLRRRFFHSFFFGKRLILMEPAMVMVLAGRYFVKGGNGAGNECRVFSDWFDVKD